MPLTYNEQTDAYESGDETADVKSPFSELNVASRSAVLSLVSSDPLSTLRDWTVLAGAGVITHETDTYHVQAPSSGDSAILESAGRGRYLAGFASEVGIGIQLGSRAAGSQVEWGAFDGDDGFRFRRDDSGFYTEVVRDGVVTKSSERANWNVDKLDGDGPSGLDISDVDTFLQQGWVWQVRWTWYGYGAIEWRLVAPAPSDRHPQEVWTLHRDKPLNQTSIRQPHLPVRARAWDGADLHVGGRQYSIIGGNAFTVARSVGDFRLGQSITDDGSWRPVIAVRRNPSEDFAKGVTLTTDDLNLNADVKVVAQVFICPAGTVTDGAWVDVRNSPPGESAAQVNRTATAALNLTGCVPLDPIIVSSGDAKRGGQLQSATKRTTLPRDLEMVLAVRGAGQGVAAVDGVLSWLETR